MPDRNGAQELRDRPVGELLKELSSQTATLVRKELELARAELAQKGRTAGAGAGMFGGAGVLGLGAFGALTACLILALDEAVAAWLAALIVAAVYGAIAGALALAGRRKTNEAAPPVPEQTVETLKEDVEWAKTRTRSAGR
jgi:uncharacterized membrane protein YqjE